LAARRRIARLEPSLQLLLADATLARCFLFGTTEPPAWAELPDDLLEFVRGHNERQIVSTSLWARAALPSENVGTVMDHRYQKIGEILSGFAERWVNQELLVSRKAAMAPEEAPIIAGNRVLLYPGLSGEAAATPVVPGSMLDWLRYHSEVLGGRHGVPADQVVKVILIGSFPLLTPVFTSVICGPEIWVHREEAANPEIVHWPPLGVTEWRPGIRTEIVIRISEPWLTDDELIEVYHDAREALAKVMPKSRRSEGWEDALAAFSLATQGMTPEKRWRKWNTMHPNRQYKSWRELDDACKKAKRAAR
jgi:hypothetical protein